jgi:DNA-3-methyladenine glycosylase
MAFVFRLMPQRSRRRIFAPLNRSFYARPVIAVARDLLGMQLIRESPEGICRGRIVEVEAYLPKNDSACHAARGMTPRNVIMFGKPGHAYVYAIHSRWCVNVVTEPENIACAVLIRALEPLEGEPLMQARRGTDVLLDLARGPARLCEAMAIDRGLNGCDMTLGKTFWIAEHDRISRKNGATATTFDIAISPRIGVTSAKELQLRYFVRDNPFVSGPKYWHRERNN